MTLYNEIPQRVNEIKTKFPVENEMLLLRHFAIRAIIMNRDEDDEVYHIKSERFREQSHPLAHADSHRRRI